MSACGANYSEEDLTPTRAEQSNYKVEKGLNLEKVKLVRERKGRKRNVTYQWELHAILKEPYNGKSDIEFLSDNVKVSSDAEKNTLDVWVSQEGDIRGVKALYLTPKEFKSYQKLMKKERNS